jgi:hypothetical protein
MNDKRRRSKRVRRHRRQKVLAASGWQAALRAVVGLVLTLEAP